MALHSKAWLYQGMAKKLLMSLPVLWKDDGIKVKEITDYFSGSNVVMPP